MVLKNLMLADEKWMPANFLASKVPPQICKLVCFPQSNKQPGIGLQVRHQQLILYFDIIRRFFRH